MRLIYWSKAEVFAIALLVLMVYMTVWAVI